MTLLTSESERWPSLSPSTVELLEIVRYTQASQISGQTDWTYLQKSESGPDFQAELCWYWTKSSYRNGESKECEVAVKSVSLPMSAAQVTSFPHQFFHRQCGGNELPVQQRIRRFWYWVFVRQRHRDACAFVWLHLPLAHLVSLLQQSGCSHTCEWVHTQAQHSWEQRQSVSVTPCSWPAQTHCILGHWDLRRCREQEGREGCLMNSRCWWSLDGAVNLTGVFWIAIRLGSHYCSQVAQRCAVKIQGTGMCTSRVTTLMAYLVPGAVNILTCPEFLLLSGTGWRWAPEPSCWACLKMGGCKHREG